MRPARFRASSRTHLPQRRFSPAARCTAPQPCRIRPAWRTCRKRAHARPRDASRRFEPTLNLTLSWLWEIFQALALGVTRSRKDRSKQASKQAKFCNLILVGKTLDEICQIYIPLQLSDLKDSANSRHEFFWYFHNFFKKIASLFLQFSSRSFLELAKFVGISRSVFLFLMVE